MYMIIKMNTFHNWKSKDGISMICGKCGHDVQEGTKFCPECGHSFSGKGNAKRTVVIIFYVTALLILSVVMFLFGHYFGKTETGKSFYTPNIIAAISERIKSLTYVPVDIELNSEDLNNLIQKSSDRMSPVKDVVLSFPAGGGISVSGMVEKRDLSDLFGNTIPELIIMFLPDDVALAVHADPAFLDGQIQTRIDSVTIAGITLGEETLSFLGADSLVSDTVSGMLKAEYGDKIEIRDIAVRTTENGEKALWISAYYYFTK